MLWNIIDTHAHYNDERFASDRDVVLSSLPDAGIRRVINCGTDVPSSLESLRLSEKYGFVWFAAGIHPEDCDGPSEKTDPTELRGLLTHEKCVAVGEIGLDYYWQEVPRELQVTVFEAQLRLAEEYGKPVIIHDREAHGDTLTLVQKYRPRGVLHCFSGSVETMRAHIKLGMYIGVGGSVTFKNAKKTAEIAKEVPLDRLLLETDCPYMAPVPYRGKRNTSAFLQEIALTVASIRGMDAQTLVDRTAQNAERLFFGGACE